MDIKSWDPLQSMKEVDAEILTAAQKRQIKNILKSYVGMYDSFSELIQNAMDAVDRRTLTEATFTEKRIWLTIDLSENSFTIIDNGAGFNQKEFESFLAPNISFKENNGSRGNKGVGATYIGYGFEHLLFGTRSSTYEFSGELLNGRSWVEDFKGLVTRPIVRPASIDNEIFKTLEKGSIFQIKFGGTHTRPKDLSWYSASTPEQWLYLLLTKTPLGSIPYLEENGTDTPILFNLSVVDKNGTLSRSKDVTAKYYFPHEIIKASINLKEVIEIQTKLIGQGKDPSKIPPKYLKANGIYEFFNTPEIISLNLSEEHKALANQYKIEAYAYFSYSTHIWDQLNDDIAKLRKGYRVVKGGLQLANNKMIQGELIAIPLTSNIGYQNQAHIIVHFRDAEPDLGRKGFQPELKEAAEKISVAIVNRLKSWKKLLRSDTGEKTDIKKELDLHDWIKAQEQHEAAHPLNLTNKNFFAPINEISIVSEPQSEQDVIVLFNQLIAGGVIRGLSLLATSQAMQYDGVFKFTVKPPISNHHFNKLDNPLGVDEFKLKGELTSPPKILEYKFNLDALINEFECDYKSEKDIHLAVVWEMGQEWRKNYDAISLLDLENLHLRDFHGITHILSSTTSRFYVISLKELIAYLNDVDGTQSHQKQMYSDNIS